MSYLPNLKGCVLTRVSTLMAGFSGAHVPLA